MNPTKRAGTFRAFRNRNYTLYFSGQSLSLIGTWMQRTGVSWLIFTMTQSPFMLGVSVFASQFPSFILSLPGGVLSDRYDRYKILLITQIASLVQAALLAAFTLTGHVSVAVILALSVVLGIINAFDVPVRQPLVHEMVHDKEDLPNALALNSSMVNLARLAGPALAGLVLHHLGAGICFLLNAISFIAVLTSLLMMKFPAFVKPDGKSKALEDIAEGWHYLKSNTAIGTILLLLALMSFLVLPYDTLIPVFAQNVFHGNASTFGYISSFVGLGAICGTLFLASLKTGADLKFVLLINIILLGLGLIFFSRISSFPFAMVFAVIAGFGGMSQTTICLTILQVKSDAHMRGRVMSFLAMSFLGMLPLGGLLTGSISEKVGAPATLLCQGILSLVIAAFFSGFLRTDRLNQKEKKEIEERDNEVIQHL